MIHVQSYDQDGTSHPLSAPSLLMLNTDITVETKSTHMIYTVYLKRRKNEEGFNTLEALARFTF
jgi:hypothetical protein